VDGVDVILDVNHSAISLAINRLTEANGKVIINTGAASASLTNEGCAANAIHYTFDTYALANGVVEGLAQIGGNQDRWFVVGVDYTFGRQMTEMFTDFAKQKGSQVIGTVYHPLNASDLSSFMLAAQQSKAENIALTNAGADLVNALKAAKEFGIVPKQRIVPTLMLINNVHSLGFANSEGLVFTEGFYWNRTPQTREWSRRFFPRTKQMPSMVHAGTYSAVTHYLKAIQAAGTDDGKTVVAQMKKTPINDMFAENGRIRADGRMVHDMYLVQVKKASESKEPWDYYNVLATIPGDKAFQPLSKSKCPLVKQGS
jgi:branched-chain amino acid transport system substrate-binding protein